MNTSTLPHVFTAADRCDRCGAQAQVRAVLDTGDLMFCGHHFTQHQARLVDVVRFVDAAN